MPIVLPAEPWKQTGRWQAYGDEVFKLADRHGREMILGPTQEEVVALLASGDLPSYRDLPVNLYQIEWKYRDEFRPRFGLLRGREFLMKDAYSFDRDDDGLRESYRIMYESYERVFDRCSLDYVIVEADPGTIGGGVNHEFMALADGGGGPVRRMRERRLPRRHGGRDARAARAGRRAGRAAGRGRHAGRRHDRPRGRAAGRPAGAHAEVHPVRHRRTDRCRAGPGRPRGERGTSSRAGLPREGPRVRRRRLRRARVREGLRGPSRLRRRRHDLRRPVGARRRQLGDGRQPPRRHVTGANVDRDFRVDRYEDLVEIREGDRCPVDGGRAADRAVDRRGPHLPARDDLLGAAGRDVRGRGRHGEAVRDGVLRDRHLAGDGGRGRAAATTTPASSGRRRSRRSRSSWSSRIATTTTVRPRRSASTGSCGNAVSRWRWTTAPNAPG